MCPPVKMNSRSRMDIVKETISNTAKLFTSKELFRLRHLKSKNESMNLLRALRARELISLKVKQKKTSYAQNIFQSNKGQIFNYKCTFDNYPKCDIVVRISVVAF